MLCCVNVGRSSKTQQSELQIYGLLEHRFKMLESN